MTLIRRLATAVGLLSALIGAEGPEFAQQYRQRLAGAIDELQRVVATFETDAARHALSPEAAIRRLESSPDPLARDEGAAAAENSARLARLKASLAVLKDAPPVARLLAFVKTFDRETAAGVLRDFEPAAPTSGEAFVIGGVAFVAGWGATHLIAWSARRRLGRRRPIEPSGRAVAS